MDEKHYDAGGVLIKSVTYDLARSEVTVFENGQTTTLPADPSIIAAIVASAAVEARRARLDTAAATLRAWSAEAATTNVGPMTVTQHKAVTQTLVNRLGVFFDRFADLLDER